MKPYVVIAPRSKALYVKMFIEALERLNIKPYIISKLINPFIILKLVKHYKEVLFIHLNWVEYLYTPARLRRRRIYPIFVLCSAIAYVIILNIIRILFNRRIVTVLHNVYPHDSKWPFFDFVMTKITLIKSDLVVAHSLLAFYFAWKVCDIKPDNILHLTHPKWGRVYGDTLTVKEAKESLGFKDTDVVIGFIGNISRYKGVDLLLQAFSQLQLKYNNIFLLIAGNCDDKFYEEYLRQLVSKLDITKRIILITRYIPDINMERYVKTIDIAVIPYVRTTTPSNIMLFSSYGKVVVVPSKITLREVLRDYDLSFYFKGLDNLVQILDTIIANSIYRDVHERDMSTEASKKEWVIYLKLLFEKLFQGELCER